MYKKNLENLKEFLSFNKKLTHYKGKRTNLFPFFTRNPERPKFKDGFNGVIGEFCRLITGKVRDDNYSIKDAITYMVNNGNVQFENNKQKNKFKNMLENYVYPNNELEILSPQLFLYLPLSDSKESKGEKEIALFIRDVLWQENEKIKNFLLEKEPETVLTRFFINNFNLLKKRNKKKNKYNKKLNYISDLFMKDFEYLIGYEDYFMDNFHYLLSYYYFYYITQLYLKLRKNDQEKKHELYYILNWEAGSKKRKSYKYGYYKEIKRNSEKLLPQIYAIEYLNFLFDETGKTLDELREIYNDLSENNKAKLKAIIKEWIIEYRDNRGLDNLDLDEKKYENLIEILINSLDQAVKTATKSRYRLSLDEIGKKYFLKSRGSLSYVGNITKEFLIFLTAVSVNNDERIKVKELFERYEKRGIYLDRYSKREVLEFLNKLNVLDKKSDSGDAQYVKAIL
ncbi:MAG: DNA phosphorothioation-dependent restriction protein DptG [Bacillota bacterium]